MDSTVYQGRRSIFRIGGGGGGGAKVRNMPKFSAILQYKILREKLRIVYV